MLPRNVNGMNYNERPRNHSISKETKETRQLNEMHNLGLSLAEKKIGGTNGKSEYLWITQYYSINIYTLILVTVLVLMSQNNLILSEYILEYVEVRGHHVCKLCSRVSEKICTCISRVWREKEVESKCHMLKFPDTLVNDRNSPTIPATFL